MILGVDFGDSRTGYATSDPLGLTAHTYETFTEKSMQKVAEHTVALVKELGAEKIVLGFPKNMNNTIGERAEKSLELKEMLERRIGIPVIMWDERLTTVEAERTLMESGVRREERKKYVDKIAAVFILQGYLNSL